MTDCPECSSSHIIQDYKRGEILCNNCGAVIADKLIDSSPDWKNFEYNNSKEHVGPPIKTKYPDSLRTDISNRNSDSQGKPIPDRNRSSIYRMRKLHRWNRGDKNLRTLRQGTRRISILVGQMELPENVGERAAFLYRTALEKNLALGRGVEQMVAGAIYTACKDQNVPRTLNEISISTKVDEKTLGRIYRTLKRELGLGIETSKSSDYIERFCTRLNLDLNVQNEARRILDLYETNNGGNFSPTGIAAGVIYYASIKLGKRATQGKIAEVAGVSEVTLRNRYKTFLEENGQQQ